MELNADQRRAVEAVRGPVCILAGAGSGKTTTITHRIAGQVATGTFRPSQILAVTFTDKAAAEMRARLERLGVTGVRASTFHSAALSQLRHFRPDAVGRILPSKALVVRNLMNALLPVPYKFRAAGDLATEIEWAHNRRIPPGRYLDSLDGHTPPIPPDLMHRVYRRYEEKKRAEGLMDFEDLLERAIELYDDEHTTAEFRDRYAAFTVDEYQDVNLLQQTLLERWLGPRDDLCVVGDDYQSIYGFTGATPQYLLAFRERAQVFRLEDNYRSVPQVLALANRLVPELGGAEKVLRATRPDGAEPELRSFATGEAECAYLVERIRAAGCPLEEIAILCRTHARLADFEAALHEAGIHSQGAALLTRDAARRLLRALDDTAPAVERVRAIALDLGWLPARSRDEKLGEREETRQSDLDRLVKLSEQVGGTGADFKAEVERRFGDGGDSRRGVHLLTYHGAKGLEFEVVLLPRVEEKELPHKQARTPDDVAEERRLFYVGLTRAKRVLAVTWVKKPSRFLVELTDGQKPPEERPEGFEALKEWRLARARAEEIPAYLVFHNSTLAEIAGRRPRSLAELAAVPGVGPAKLERYGEDVLAALAAI